MKKSIFIPFILIFLLAFCLTSCSPKTSNNQSNNQPKVSNTNTARSKEFSYLPGYNKDLKADKYFPSSKTNTYNIGIYTIKNTTADTAYKNYKKILQDDGWKITQDVPSHSVSASKGSHTASMVFQQSGSDTKLTIASK